MKTLHASVALAEGAKLLICVNPLTPLDADAVARKSHRRRVSLTARGLPAVMSQTFRALIHSRMRVGMERYAKAAGLTASCHSLRHTFASNLLEHGAEVVAIRDFLGHSQIASSERYAKVSSQKVKQEYLRTMQKILKHGQV